MKKKSGFTLVEMLIVVIIIGILAAAILPRLTGAMARSRDLKRQTDLRNIGIAIQMYCEKRGSLPTKGRNEWTENTRGTLQASPCQEAGLYLLSTPIGLYLSEVPTDPQKNAIVRIHEIAKKDGYFVGKYKSGVGGATCGNGLHGQGGNAIQYGQYLYQIVRKGDTPMGAAILVAKTETADLSNYVRIFDREDPHGGYIRNNNKFDIKEDLDNIYLCTSIDKVKKGEEKFDIKPDGKVECAYSSEDQLYYILKVE